MGRIVYLADIGEHNIKTLADGPLARKADHIRAVGGTVILDDEALEVLRFLNMEQDGYVDYRRMWIGGTGYPLQAEDAYHLFTFQVAVEDPGGPAGWRPIDPPALHIDAGTAAQVAADLAEDEDTHPAPYRVLVWHGLNPPADPAAPDAVFTVGG